MSNERIIYVGKPPDSRLMKRVDREDIPIHTAKKIKIMREVVIKGWLLVGLTKP